MKVFYILLINAIIGAIGIWLFSAKKSGDIKKALWLKFVVYLFVVGSIVFSVQYSNGIFLALTALISSLGLFEVIKNSRKNISLLIGSVLCYGSIVAGFILFSFKCDPLTIAMVYAVAVVFDGFSQVVGQLAGKRKLVKTISPNKTIEGALGGLAFAFITYMAVSEKKWAEVSMLAVLTLISACLAGDLLASFFKRRAQVKDFSRLIPGHGGVLDRFDSFLMAGCITYLLMLFNYAV